MNYRKSQAKDLKNTNLIEKGSKICIRKFYLAQL